MRASSSNVSVSSCCRPLPPRWVIVLGLQWVSFSGREGGFGLATTERRRRGRCSVRARVLHAGRVGACDDQSCSASAGEEADRPAQDDEQPVLEADQVEEVNEQPERPGGGGGEP